MGEHTLAGQVATATQALLHLADRQPHSARHTAQLKVYMSKLTPEEGSGDGWAGRNKFSLPHYSSHTQWPNSGASQAPHLMYTTTDPGITQTPQTCTQVIG